MVKKILIAVLVLAVPGISMGQDSTMTLKGQMNLSIEKGTIECNFSLINMPKIRDYDILINAGMNIRYIRNIQDNYSYYYRRNYIDSISYESFEYYIPDNTDTGKFIPKALQFSYVGKFPVVADTLKAANGGDWKGNIAFNGYSIRADGAQSNWYPVLYDAKNDKKYDKINYDIEINCGDCNTIYLNGNDPVHGIKAHFKTDRQLEGMLFAGNYKTSVVDGTYFLNPDITEEQMHKLGEMTSEFKKYYEKKLGMPYKYNITYLQTTPISKKNAWLWVSYPTIINVGNGENGLKALFNEKAENWFKPYIAHELGHYYFGYTVKFNSPLGDMMSEGFAEYLSLQICKDVLKDTLYRAEINKKIKALKSFKPIPFAKVKSADDYKNRELYVYYYAPLIFTAIEKEIGDADMWKWLRVILETKAEHTNYAFLEQTLNTALKDDSKVKAIKEKYFESDSSLQNAVETITKK